MDGGVTEETLRAYEKSAGRARRKRRFYKLAAVFLLLFAAATALVTMRVDRLVTRLALSNTSDIVTSVVNNTIAAMMTEGRLDYGELVMLEKDDAGHITALVSNMAKINALQAEITNAVIDALGKGEYIEIRIPLGNVIGGALLSGRGPMLPVRILALPNVSTAFLNEFSDAGINQTRHQIMLSVTVSLSVLLPGKTADLAVSTEVSVAETVIVGEVPDTLRSFSE